MSSIKYAELSGTYVLKFEGHVCVNLCADFDKFIDKMVNDDNFIGVLIDLSLAKMIDSTSIGLIVKMATSLKKKGHLEKPTILSTNNDITLIIENMGLNDLFDMVDNVSSHIEEEFERLPSTKSNKSEIYQQVLSAHKELMALNNKNKETFEQLVTCLEKEGNL